LDACFHSPGVGPIPFSGPFCRAAFEESKVKRGAAKVIVTLRTTMKKLLRDQINDTVVDYLQDKLEAGEGIDVAEMAHAMSQSLVDMIMEQDEEHQAPLLASIIVSLGDEYLQRRGLLETSDQKH
jgi:DNA-binding protein Fis